MAAMVAAGSAKDVSATSVFADLGCRARQLLWRWLPFAQANTGTRGTLGIDPRFLLCLPHS